MSKNIIISMILSLVISVCVFLVGWKVLDVFDNDTVTLEGDYSLVSGVIRNNGDGWELIIDNGHQSISIDSVSADDEKIVIEYDDYSKVNSIAVTVDETMASEQITVGTSVGLNESHIFMYDKDGNTINPNEYTSESGNIWIQGIFTK